MEYVSYLAALTQQLKVLAEGCEDDAVYDELVIVANVCQQAAEAIELYQRARAARASRARATL